MNRRMVVRKMSFIVALLAIVLMSALQPAAAHQRGGAGQAGANGDAFAAMCRAAGGTPVWTTSIDTVGYVTYIVECHGGYLGGLNCFFDEQFTSCIQTRRLPEVSQAPIEVVEVAPADDPIAPQVIETVDVDPDVSTDESASDPTATPTSEPTAEPTAVPTAEPIVDDGSVVISDPVVLDGDDLPEVQTVPIVPVLEPAAPNEVITLQ